MAMTDNTARESHCGNDLSSSLGLTSGISSISASFFKKSGIRSRSSVRIINHFAKAQLADSEQHGRPGQAGAKARETGIHGASLEAVSRIDRHRDGNSRSATIAKPFDYIVGHLGMRQFHLIREFLQ